MHIVHFDHMCLPSDLSSIPSAAIPSELHVTLFNSQSSLSAACTCMVLGQGAQSVFFRGH